MFSLYGILFLFSVASGSSCDFECMGRPGAPLGAVWVKEIDTVIKRYHLDMVARELRETDGGEGSIQTNFALFTLSLTLTNSENNREIVTVLGGDGTVYKSGGLMLTDPASLTIEDVGAQKKQLRQEIAAYTDRISSIVSGTAVLLTQHQKDKGDVGVVQTKLKEASTNLDETRERLIMNKKRLTSLEDRDKEYEPELFSRDPVRYLGYTCALYDPEQIITRIVDHQISRSSASEEFFTIAGRQFNKNTIELITLNMHTRTDMCPFCIMFLAHKTQEWNQKLRDMGMPLFSTVVSSRQEYRADFPFIKTKIYYQGFSMRSFGWRSNNDTSGDRDEVQGAIRDGLVVQYAFQPWEVYDPRVVEERRRQRV